MSLYLNKGLRDLVPYTPGEQPKVKKLIKLNTNESPYPPSAGVLEVVQRGDLEDLRLYSDPEGTVLKEALAQRYGVSSDMVFCSNGSDEALDFAFEAYGEDGMAFADITYGFYEVFCARHQIGMNKIPLKEDLSIDPREYYGLGMGCVIANPNAPTGLVLPVGEIEKVIVNNPDHVVIVDEAYVDFGAQSCVPLTKKYKNLLVVQTFSKSRSLAGMRIGFAIGDPELINDLHTIQYSSNPYNLDRLALKIGAAAVKDDEYYKTRCRMIADTREKTAEELRKLGFEVTDSKANFLFARHPERSGEDLYQVLRDHGILVRHFNNKRIAEYNRITIGTEEDMEQLVCVLREAVR